MSSALPPIERAVCGIVGCSTGLLITFSVACINPIQEKTATQPQMSMEQMQQQQVKQQEQEQMRQSMMQQVMLPDARERLARIAIVKPEKARAIEDMVIQMAQRGQLAAKIDEDKLIDLLNQVGVTEEKQRTKVTMKRRTYFSDEDDDDDDDDF
ncbi:Programmed cell death protein 5 [Phytophthora citrophthora]|uniref:Programmed cell death protein 5 n=1 Tax=Phytophthora citrophthora TaxID=4793 RepID=A0AAD9LNC4_9STRA|nr:Programmed cell death protein 5 [Phytophthora citrophthora]